MRKIISTSILIIVVIIALVIYSNTNKQTVNVTTIKNQYNVVSDESKVHLKIPLYFDFYDSYYIDIDNVSSCYISGDDFNFKLDLDGISYEKEEKLNKTKYFVYIFDFTCNINEGDITISNSNIDLNYNNNISISENIGSVCIKRVNKFLDDNISITKLKGITSLIKGRTTLSGIVLEVETKKGLNSYKLRDI